MGRWQLYLAVFLVAVEVANCACARKVTENVTKKPATKKPKNKGNKDCVCEPAIPFPKPADCDEVRKNGNQKSGIYSIWPRSRAIGCNSIQVFCDMDTDENIGWTVLQRRGKFGNPKNYFVKDWADYKNGFGRVDNDFWLGNDNIFALTNQDHYAVRFDMLHVNGTTANAIYDHFWIDDELHNYKLHISGYSGNAGDSMKYHQGMPFTTRDKENSPSNQKCGLNWTGGWWFRDCHKSNLNGIQESGQYACKYAHGIEWFSFSGHCTSLVASEIKIRPAITE